MTGPPRRGTDVTFDVTPQLTNPVPTGGVVDPSDVSFAVTHAIPDEPVTATFSPQPAGAAIDVPGLVADGSGDIADIADPQPSPGEYRLALHTVDSSDIPSADATTDEFYVAPTQPAITSLPDLAVIDQSTPDVTVSGVLAGATVTLYTVGSDHATVELAQATASSAGDLTLTGADYRAGLPDGVDAIYAAQTIQENGTAVSSDGGTNAAAEQATLTDLRVDTAAPELSSPEVADGSTIADSEPSFQVSGGPEDLGADTAGVEFFVTAPDGPVAGSGVIATDGGGHAGWTVRPALPAGSYSITARSVDDTGRLGDAVSNPIAFTVAPPAATQPTTPGGGTGTSGNQGATTGPAATTGADPATTASTATSTAPPPARVKAPTKVTVSSRSLSAGHPVRVGFTLATPGPVTVRLTRTVHGRRRVVGTVVLHETRAGRESYRLTSRFDGRRLARGSYTLSVAAGRGTTVSRAVTSRVEVV